MRIDKFEVYQVAMPEHEILAFTGSWVSTDALHCRTKGIPDLEMLQIFHNPIDDQTNPQNFYAVEAIYIVDFMASSFLTNE